MTESDHYDARDARNCNNGTSRSGTIIDPAGFTSHRVVTGLQKAAGCVYRQTGPDPTYEGQCSYVPESQPPADCGFVAQRAWTHKSHAVFLYSETGELDYNNGGDQWLPNS